MKELGTLALIGLGLVAGVVVGQLLQYQQINLLKIIKKIFKK